jgi:hypothetical protein
MTGSISLFNDQHPLAMHLTGFSLNFLSLYATHYFLKRIADLLGLGYSFFDFLSFVIGSVVLYFTFFVMTCIEILALPVFTFVIYSFFKLRTVGSPSNCFVVGLSLGFLACANPTFVPFVIYLLFAHGWEYFNKKKWKQIFLLGAGATLLSSAQALNLYVKYGEVFDPSVAVRLLFDVSLFQAFYKVFYVYMVTDFWRSPLSFLGLLGALLFLWNLRQKRYIKTIDFCALSLSILTAVYVMMFFIGNIAESHLSGRHFIRVAPFFILGLSFLRGEVFKNNIKARVLQITLALWGASFILGFVANDIISPFYQAYRSFPHPSHFGEIAEKYLNSVDYRSELVLMNMHLLFLFSLCVTLLIFLFKKSNTKLKLTFFILLFISYPVMSFINWHNAPERVQELASQGVYKEKAVGHGAEIFFDYFLDTAMYIYLSNDGEFDDKLKSGLNEFFNRVDDQLIRSSPRFQKRLEKRSMDQSHWLKDDGALHRFRLESDGEPRSKRPLQHSRD